MLKFPAFGLLLLFFLCLLARHRQDLLVPKPPEPPINLRRRTGARTTEEFISMRQLQRETREMLSSPVAPVDIDQVDHGCSPRHYRKTEENRKAIQASAR